MRHAWEEAKAYNEACRLGAEVDHNECIDDNIEDTETCNDQRDEREAICQDVLMRAVNALPIRECGEPVFIVAGHLDDPNYGYTVNENDADGDGISAWDEYLMGLNPCTIKSDYHKDECVNDGTLDYDADGIPNGEDPEPLCHGEFGEGDPAGYVSDCV